MNQNEYVLVRIIALLISLSLIALLTRSNECIGMCLELVFRSTCEFVSCSLLSLLGILMQITVSWDIMPCILVVCYHHFRRSCCHKPATKIGIGIRRRGPPLWSGGQSSWLQIRRPGFDSRH
jgi:hypothetical protein